MRRSPAPYVIAGAVLLLLALAAVLLVRGGADASSPPVDATRLADDPALGPATARVTIEEFADFGCSACRAWHNAGILQQIRAQYGDQVRFVWRDFPVITPQSPQAAEAAQCAYDQQKFWEYHDELYQQFDLSVGALKGYAAQLGLDTAIFNACLDSGQHRSTVARDLQESRQRRFPGTPSFLLNGRMLAGPPSLDYLRQLVDAALAQP